MTHEMINGECPVMPLISVIVPMFNVEKFIPDCLESLRRQTFTEFECICVDDGSPDRCAEIALQYAALDARFRLIRQDNQGLSGARNTGIRSATADFVFFLDSDDFLAPRALDTLYRYSIDHNADIVGCDYRHVPEDASLDEEPSRTEDESDYVLSNKPLIDWLDGRLPLQIIACGKLYKRKLFDGNLFPIEMRIHEDCVICPRLLHTASVAIALPMPLYVYRIRNGSLTKSQRYTDSLHAYVDTCMQLKTFAAEANLDPAQSSQLYAMSALQAFLSTVEQSLISPQLSAAMRAEILRTAIQCWQKLLLEGIATSMRPTLTERIMIFLCFEWQQILLFRVLLRLCHPAEWKRLRFA